MGFLGLIGFLGLMGFLGFMGLAQKTRLYLILSQRAKKSLLRAAAAKIARKDFSRFLAEF
jgi:hypothetical protein